MTRISYSLILFSLLLSLINTSCSETFDGCDRFADWRIITENDRGKVCIYQHIYLYKDEYYTVCECCLCGKVLTPAIGCNEEPLCELSEGCMTDFFDKAEYLFSAVAE